MEDAGFALLVGGGRLPARRAHGIEEDMKFFLGGMDFDATFRTRRLQQASGVRVSGSTDRKFGEPGVEVAAKD